MSPFWAVLVESAALAPGIVSVLGGAAVRGVIVLLLAGAAVRFWPRTVAVQRHLVWAVACGSLLVLPVVSLVVPRWRVSVPVLPATPVAPLSNRVQVADQRAISIPTDVVHRDASGGLATTTAWSFLDWQLLVLVGWGIGTVVVLTVLVDSQRTVRRIASDALTLTDVRMLNVLARAKRTVRVVQRVPVKLHAATVPMVCGVLRPTIVLPASACMWEEKRLYNVLVHELSHIKRYDSLTQAGASLVCVLYWFNPLVWLAVRRLQAEQEQACDDAVLSAGSRPREYATDLLELTHLFQPTDAMSLAALPFARLSELEGRMQAIVDRSRCRGHVSRWGVLAVWGAGVFVTYPLAGLTPHIERQARSTDAATVRHIRSTASMPRVFPPVSCCAIPSVASKNKPQLTQEQTLMKNRFRKAMVAATVAAAPLAGTAQSQTGNQAPMKVDTLSFHMTTINEQHTSYETKYWERTTFSNGNCVERNLERKDDYDTLTSDTLARENGYVKPADSVKPFWLLDGVPSNPSVIENVRKDDLESWVFLAGPFAVKKYGIVASAGAFLMTSRKTKYKGKECRKV